MTDLTEKVGCSKCSGAIDINQLQLFLYYTMYLRMILESFFLLIHLNYIFFLLIEKDSTVYVT